VVRLRILLFLINDRWFRFLQGIFSKSFGDRHDHNPLRIVGKHQRACNDDKPSKRCCKQVQDCFLFHVVSIAHPYVRDKIVAPSLALLWCVSQKLHFRGTKVALRLAVDFKPRAVRRLLPEQLSREPVTLELLERYYLRRC
jgi:hypothetical protein